MLDLNFVNYAVLVYHMHICNFIRVQDDFWWRQVGVPAVSLHYLHFQTHSSYHPTPDVTQPAIILWWNVILECNKRARRSGPDRIPSGLRECKGNFQRRITRPCCHIPALCSELCADITHHMESPTNPYRDHRNQSPFKAEPAPRYESYRKRLQKRAHSKDASHFTGLMWNSDWL